MTTAQAQSLYRVLAATAAPIMEDPNVRHSVKVELQAALFGFRQDFGLPQYVPSDEERRRMEENGEG
jgi:hypothetical protein